ncbi:hypothetical protein T492DRAFT_489560 [Pavlovales sp. CCMP2436]|nr:hypothetical protein T492DRAFT_489560 [Pavlovales sp. CCMP2436]
MGRRPIHESASKWRPTHESASKSSVPNPVRELLRRIFTGLFRNFPPDWPLIRISTLALIDSMTQISWRPRAPVKRRALSEKRGRQHRPHTFQEAPLQFKVGGRRVLPRVRHEDCEAGARSLLAALRACLRVCCRAACTPPIVLLLLLYRIHPQRLPPPSLRDARGCLRAPVLRLPVKSHRCLALAEQPPFPPFSRASSKRPPRSRRKGRELGQGRLGARLVELPQLRSGSRGLREEQALVLVLVLVFFMKATSPNA